MTEFVILVTAGLANGSLYALVALGLVLIYKAQDMVQFGFGEIFMAGAFIGYSAYSFLGLSYPASFLLAILAGGLVGLLIERGLIRPIAHFPHMTLVMVTVGLSFMLKGIFRIPFAQDVYTIPPMFGGSPIIIFDLVFASQNLLTTATSLVLTLGLLLLFAFTDLGKQMRATAENMFGAQYSGINIGLVFATTWGLASVMGAAAGILSAPITALFPDMGTRILIRGFAAAVLGGFGSVPGAIVGGYLIGVIETLFGFYVATALIDLSAFLVIMVVLIFWPRGLFGTKEITRV